MADKSISSESNAISYRSGVAARLAGLSPETLRVWERRYEVSGAERSARGQRLYSAEQVDRLRMLKQLVDQGHAIGGLVRMSDEHLHELAGVSHAQPQADGPITLGVIGSTLAKRIAASGLEGLDITVQYRCNQLDQTALQTPDSKVEVLVIEQSELHESAIPLIVSAGQACGAAVVVLYRFCASATIRTLRAHGCLVARVPTDISELILLCQSALAGDRLPPEQAPPMHHPRFDENALLAMMGANSGLTCECPKHLADVLLTVGSFERYSSQCASRNDDDARLHKALQHAAAQARSILEVAMEKLARAEGLSLPGNVT